MDCHWLLAMAGLVVDSVALDTHHHIADPRSSDNFLTLRGIPGTRMGVRCHVAVGGAMLITSMSTVN